MPKKSLLVRILTIASLFLNLQWGIVSASPVDTELQNAILYVKPGANGDCLSWDTACELQTAIFNAVSGDQIWVAAGSYKPTTDTNRTAAFQLKSGVAIYGGFPAAGGDWSQRDWETYPATLSGDIGVSGDNADNSYHVVKSNGVDASAILDGFTISLGYATGTSDNTGGGMYNRYSSPILSNVTFSGNTASYYGGGMYNRYSSPILSNVTFSGNTASKFGGGMYNAGGSPTLSDVTFSGNTAGDFGGGMYNNSSATLTNVTFSSNTASYYGGGMYNNSSSPILRNVTFSGNTAGDYGGGMSNDNGSPILSNVTFSDNTAGDFGGGMSNTYGSISTLTNVTFSGNTASYYGGGMFNSQSSASLSNVTFSGNTATSYYGGGMYNDNSSASLTNAILWGNTPDQIRGDSTTVTYSDVQGGYAGTGNINADPLLGPLADNGGFTQTHAIAAGSPAIDAGDPDVCPNIDQRAFTRPIDGDENGTAICDMGAYEYGSYPAVFSLTVGRVGNGTTTKNPDKLGYRWGESVTLTATADPDWLFIGWSGDVTGNDNPLVITITGNTNVTALFTTNRIFLPMITR